MPTVTNLRDTAASRLLSRYRNILRGLLELVDDVHRAPRSLFSWRRIVKKLLLFFLKAQIDAKRNDDLFHELVMIFGKPPFGCLKMLHGLNPGPILDLIEDVSAGTHDCRKVAALGDGSAPGFLSRSFGRRLGRSGRRCPGFFRFALGLKPLLLLLLGC